MKSDPQPAPEYSDIRTSGSNQVFGQTLALGKALKVLIP